jgi:ribose transport system ATP-binding protein/rhamnose transport system ATP-binding protein
MAALWRYEDVMAPRIEARNVTKTFPGVTALDDVSMAVERGEIRALLGENGAGKSTLGKIVAGIHPATAGALLIDGAEVRIADERAAGAMGIGIVHQEGSLVPQLSVAENIFAGRQPTGWLGQVDVAAMRAEAARLIAELGVVIDPARKVADLSPAQAQIVEIAKALSRDLRILILDEPTAALTLNETDKLFEAVRKLAATGVSVIYVSHRLAEIFALCHTVTVLKDGRQAGTRVVAETDAEDLIRLMVGRDVHLRREARMKATGAVVLQAKGIRATPFVQDAAITVHAGEIVCLAGLIGSGRSEFCETIFGARARQAGTISIEGRAIDPKGPWDGKAAGIGMVPEDRKTSGLFLGMDIVNNIAATVMHRIAAGLSFSEARAEALAQGFVNELKIATPGVRQIVGNLSGGNQQKVLIAKWLAMEPKLLIVDEPTRGVDVGARAEIYRLLRALADRGVALLVVSSDLPEVLSLADRIVVMAEGRTVGELSGDHATEEDVLRLATRFTASVAEVRHDLLSSGALT